MHQFQYFLIFIILKSQNINNNFFCWSINMKISLKSAINTTNPIFSLFEDNKYMFLMGRNICIKQFNKQNYSFIPLHQQTESVLDIKVSSNRKSINVLEIINNTELYLSLYNFKGERKALRISNKPIVFIKMLPGVNQSTYLNIWINYGVDNHIMQIDTNKMRIIANVYTGDHICCVQNHLISPDIVSVTGKSFIKIYKIVNYGFQQISEPSKKISTRQYNIHCWFDNSILIVGSGNQILVLNNNELVNTLLIQIDITQEITNIVKINKCFIVTSNRGKCFMFIQQQQYKFIPYQHWQIQKKNQKNAKIECIYINNNQDLIVIRTNPLNLFVSKILQIEPEIDTQKLNFHQVDEMITNINPKGFSFSDTKDLGLFIDSNAYTCTVFNIFPRKCILKKQFNPTYKQNKSNILISGALHPNGYSIVLSFVDKIRFYHLLAEDIKQYQQLNYQKVKGFKYSQGGHLLSFYTGKLKNYKIFILNTLSMTEICNLSIENEIISMNWIKNDSEFMCIHPQQISIWKTSQNFKQLNEIKINQDINNAYFDDKTQHIIVSTNSKIIQIQNLKIVSKIQPNIPDFDFIFPFAQKYLISDLKGNVYLSNSIQFKKYEKLCVSQGRAQIFFRNFNLIYFSQKYSELCLLNYQHIQKLPQEEYVLVVKSQIEKHVQKVKGVESLLQDYQSEILSKLQQEKNKFQTIQQINQKKFKRELDNIQNNYSLLLADKIKAQKTSVIFFEGIEQQHIKAVDQLEKLYDNKLSLLQKQILNLQDKLVEQRTISNKRLVQLQKKYQNDVIYIRKQYQQNIKKIIVQNKGMANRHISNKKQIEAKIIDIQQENELVILDLQIHSETIIKDLKFKLFQSEQNIKYKNQAIQRLNDQIQKWKNLFQQKCKQYDQIVRKLQQSKNRIKHIEKQIKMKDDLIKSKQIYINQFQEKIQYLQKTKNILSFRTTQIRKQLQPKQSYIQKLKSQLSKLSDELDKETSQKFQLKQKAQKQKKTVSNLNTELNQYKNKLKKSKYVYSQITHQINRIITTVDPKDWNPQFIKFYQRYIKSQKVGESKKGFDQNTIQQMNRHLIHVQHSLYQATISNQQALKGRQKQITRKFKQNAELIHELNDLRKREKNLKDEMQIKNLQLVKLKKELAITPRHTKRIQSAGTTIITRKTMQQQPVNLESVDSSFRVVNQTRKSQYNNSTAQTRPRTSNRILSANRPIIFKGNNYDSNTSSLIQRNRIYELNIELQVSQNKIKSQQKTIDELSKKIMILEAQKQK